ncbi:MAG: class I SAM-dependent methyltransferase [Betaproteobacteria bacterium]|jgi:SAM-dependent methyltransferase|nr:class I SAM-dependent methyltransferase [Betaproteobacteria bacterium]
MPPSRTPPQSPTTLEFQERDRFDLDYGTNTTTPLAKSGFPDLPNLAHGKPYMASWTSEIQQSFRLLTSSLGPRMPLYSFVDIGCGKGKVPIVWRLSCEASGIRQRIVGLDYVASFIDIAQQNHRKVFGNDGEFIAADATDFRYETLGNGLIAYLYNPFDNVILDKVLRQLRRIPCVVIYNIPTHADCLPAHGFELIHQRRGINQNQETKIFSNHRRPASEASMPRL